MISKHSPAVQSVILIMLSNQKIPCSCSLDLIPPLEVPCTNSKPWTLLTPKSRDEISVRGESCNILEVKHFICTLIVIINLESIQIPEVSI
jgi:hypothetical protein